jgi:hypothetical protein
MHHRQKLQIFFRSKFPLSEAAMAPFTSDNSGPIVYSSMLCLLINVFMSAVVFL